MSWPYYFATIAVILAGAVFCFICLSKYRAIKRAGVIVTCEILDSYTPYSTRIAKEFVMDVSFEHEGITRRASCKMRRFSYYKPKVGEFLQFIYIPGNNETVFPTKVNRYPIFNTAVMMAAVSILFAAGLVATIISLTSG